MTEGSGINWKKFMDPHSDRLNKEITPPPSDQEIKKHELKIHCANAVLSYNRQKGLIRWAKKDNAPNLRFLERKLEEIVAEIEQITPEMVEQIGDDGKAMLAIMAEIERTIKAAFAEEDYKKLDLFTKEEVPENFDRSFLNLFTDLGFNIAYRKGEKGNIIAMEIEKNGIKFPALLLD